MRRSLVIFFASLAACGGGGAAIEAPTSEPTTNPPGATPSNPSSPSTPASPGNSVVTTVGTTFSPASVTVPPGSVVTWQITGGTHNVTFGATKPTGGDVGDTNAGAQVARTFATAGTFDYECTRHSGMVGRVVVSADGSAPVAPPSTPTEGTLVQATASAFSPERVEIGSGGVITWQFNQGAGGIVFDEAAPTGGNIPAGAAGTTVSRTFTSPGDYDYHSTLSSDVKGRIRVR